jgi:hypothetical protein
LAEEFSRGVRAAPDQKLLDERRAKEKLFVLKERLIKEYPSTRTSVSEATHRSPAPKGSH